MGVIAYELVFGRLPWKDKNESVLYDKIMSSSLEDLFDNEIPLS